MRQQQITRKATPAITLKRLTVCRQIPTIRWTRLRARFDSKRISNRWLYSSWPRYRMTSCAAGVLAGADRRRQLDLQDRQAQPEERYAAGVKGCKATNAAASGVQMTKRGARHNRRQLPHYRRGTADHCPGQHRRALPATTASHRSAALATAKGAVTRFAVHNHSAIFAYPW